MSEFIIKSSISDLSLKLSDMREDCFKVRLQSIHLNIFRDVSIYTDRYGFSDFLQRLVIQKKPWKGKENWESIEGDFKLIATCNALGQVTFEIALVHAGSDEDWFIKANLVCELGQLKELAASVRKFLNG